MDSFESLKAVQSCYTKEKLAIQRHINKPDQEAVLNTSRKDALSALEAYFLNLKNFQESYPDHSENELVIESLKKFTKDKQNKLPDETKQAADPILEITLHEPR